MSAAPFFPQLEAQVAAKNSLLCVGLDPHAAELEAAGFGNNADGAKAFCLKLIEATAHIAVAYKPNAAFFEQFGSAGWSALEEVTKAIPPEIPIVFDAKRGKIISLHYLGLFEVREPIILSNKFYFAHFFLPTAIILNFRIQVQILICMNY